MRFPLLALVAPLLLALPAAAQVTIDLRALDPLPLPGLSPLGEPRPRPAPPPQPRVAAPIPTTTGPSTTGPTTTVPTTAIPATPAQPKPSPAATTQAAGTAPEQQPALPIVTPPTADLAPIPPPPAATEAPPPPPVSVTAATRAEPTQAGLRVTFDAAATDLSPASLSAIKAFTAATPNADTVSFNVLAYAAGKTDDPSVARRLSLSRALAVRSALIAEGIASTRIYVRALGSQTAGGPPDRVDVSLLGANAAAPR